MPPDLPYGSLQAWLLLPRFHSVICRTHLQALKAMLGPKTRLVATVHVSNMLGSVTDIAKLSHAVHAVRRFAARERGLGRYAGPVPWTTLPTNAEQKSSSLLYPSTSLPF